MTEYAISTNLIGWGPIQRNRFGWPLDGPEGELVTTFEPGDLLIPKFAQNPEYVRAGGQSDYQRGVCQALDLDYGEQLEAYELLVAGGQGAVPMVLRVVRRLPPFEGMPSGPWAMVAVAQISLRYPLTTQEFLKLRVTPLTLARQFKAMAAPGRHIQEVPDGMAHAILDLGIKRPEDRVAELRRFSLVKADTPDEAVARLADAGRPPQRGDRAVLVNERGIPGVHSVAPGGRLVPDGEAINIPPDALLDLFTEAKRRQVRSFRPYNPLAAASALADLMGSDRSVEDIEQFSHYHDLYVRLPRNVNQALHIVRLPAAPADGAEGGQSNEDADENPAVEELENLLGLTVEAVRNRLPGFALADSVFNEAVTALRSGKHLLLSGPPGTGKSTVATAICKAVVDEQFDVATATADWTTFDTIGGYLPTPDATLRFEPGIVLRALERSHWLVIDELNRADIDKAFGPLFTLLAGTDSQTPAVGLPFRGKDGTTIRIDWSETSSEGSGPYTVTPSWRLIGTLNLSDKATLFQLSFAFLRRFAVVEVPLPPPDAYAELFGASVADVDEDARPDLIAAAMALAFGPRQLGPAILLDIAAFTSTGTTPTQTGQPPFADPVEAFLTAVRLYAVPQYEGADRAEIDAVLSSLEAIWPDRPAESWTQLGRALASVALT